MNPSAGGGSDPGPGVPAGQVGEAGNCRVGAAPPGGTGRGYRRPAGDDLAQTPPGRPPEDDQSDQLDDIADGQADPPRSAGPTSSPMLTANSTRPAEAASHIVVSGKPVPGICCEARFKRATRVRARRAQMLMHPDQGSKPGPSGPRPLSRS